MKLHTKSFALAFGALEGLSFFAFALLALYYGYGVEIVEAIGPLFPSGLYTASWNGAFWGLVIGFIDGYIGGAIFALLYNWCLDLHTGKKKKKKRKGKK